MSLADRCPASCPAIAPGPSGQPAEHRFVEANGIRFHTVEMGAGPTVLLLHGFPEFWYSWRHQLPALAERFRVVAVDLRGYNLTTRARTGYTLPTLVRDVAELIHALGGERAFVVGHDWGGVIAWGAGMWIPDRVDRLAIINAPHPCAYLRELRHNWRQRRKSWYVVLFQIPWLPEWLLSRRGCQPIASLFRASLIRPDAFSEEDLARYQEVFCQPGALSAALAYYRALRRVGIRRVVSESRPIQAPTLVIWGEQDAALVPELTEGLEPWVPNARIVRVPEAGHWVHQEVPEVVNRELLEFLAAP